MIAFPALTQALQDRRLRPSDFRVYGVCLERLDFMEFRPLKAKAVTDKLTSRRARMRESHVAAALRILCRLGYLERGNLEGHTWTYRLRYSLASTCHKSDTIQAA
jgi:hypothetical protein